MLMRKTSGGNGPYGSKGGGNKGVKKEETNIAVIIFHRFWRDGATASSGFY
jgi:hypothetical protein